MYRQLILRGFVLLSFDAFVYFYPLMAHRDGRLLAGELPLWAPDYFLGAPFLANPQTAVLYPPTWLTLWLIPPRAYAWQLFGHSLLCAAGAYVFARRALALGRLAGVVGALIAALGGFAQSMVGHVNQLQGAAWLPWAALLADEAWRRGSRRATAGLGVVLALQVLAGHAQQSYMTVAFLAAWLLGRWAVSALRRGAGGAVGPRPRAAHPLSPGEGLVRLVLVLGVAGVLAALLAAPELVPMQELTARGIRAGGMSYREAAAFSLPPWVLPSSLLPVFSPTGQPGSEWTGYVGVSGLVLAALGLLGGRERREAWVFGAIAAGALLLALGQLGPLYPLLYGVVPGLGLFRVPARWLFVVSFALAMLAALGAERLGGIGRRGSGGAEGDEPTASAGVDARPLAALFALFALPIVGFALYWLVGVGPTLLLPEGSVLLLWLALLLTGLALAAFGLAGWRPAAGCLAAMLAVELVAASQPLDVNRVGPPEAYTALRPIEAHLLAMGERAVGGPYRTLAITDSTFDPGDLELLRSEVEGVVDPDRVADWVAVVKHKDTLTPNLPLRFGIPSIDGYDGGLLPLRSYVGLKELFPLRSANLNDGRLGIQLERLPRPELLAWLNVRWVVMDRHRDVWVDGVYYDRAVESDLPPGRELALDGVPATARASAVGLWLAPLAAAPGGAPLGELDVAGRDGTTRTVALRAGPDGVAPGAAQLVRSSLGGTLEAARVVLRSAPGGPGLRLSGISLVDEATGVDWPLPAAAGLRFSALGDVKVYESGRTLPRAFLVHGVRPVGSDEEARALLAGGMDATQSVALVGERLAEAPDGAAEPGEAVEVVAYRPERVDLRATLARPGVLVLTDADYPGWVAEVDGQVAPILRADGGVRAVALEAGAHTVTFAYRPRTLWIGVALGVVGLIALVGLMGGRRAAVGLFGLGRHG